MEKTIITLMVLLISMIFVGHLAVMLYSLTAQLRRSYIEIDEDVYKYKAYRKMYHNY